MKFTNSLIASYERHALEREYNAPDEFKGAREERVFAVLEKRTAKFHSRAGMWSRPAAGERKGMRGSISRAGYIPGALQLTMRLRW